MKKYTLYLYAVAALSLGSLSGAPVLSLKQVPSIQEFEAFIKTSPLWRELKSPEGLIQDEIVKIEKALEAEKLTCPIVINRPISEFKGSILLIGGGQKAGDTFINRGVTCIEDKLELRNAYKNATLPFKLGDGRKIESEEDRQSAIAFLQSQIDEVLDTYYTINIDGSSQPDIVASATDLNGLACYFGNHKFDEIIYEGVPTFVFLDPRTWEVAAMLCKPGGIIRIIPGLACLRPILFLLMGTKWEGPVYSHLKASYNPAYYNYRELSERFWASVPKLVEPFLALLPEGAEGIPPEGAESVPPELEHLVPQKPAEAELVHVTLELIN